MTHFDYDLFVIGAGSGGVRAARLAAGYGARVAVAESHRFGGTCVVRGCVPKKLLVYASHYGEAFDDAMGFGWSGERAAFSWPRLIERKNEEIARLSARYEDVLRQAGVATLQGSASVLDPHTVAVDGRQVTAEHILVATGGRPFKPQIPGIELAITSNEAFDLPELPRRILVVGGGYIAVEFAGIFRGLGATVTLSYRGPQILRGFDDDVRHHLNEEMRKKGIAMLLGSTVSRIERGTDGALDVHVFGAPAPTIRCDAVMYATGRAPNTDSLGLEAVGVRLDEAGGVVTDAFGQSSVASIHAVGDVTNRIALTPVAIREGAAVAATLFGGSRTAADLHNVPSAVFSQPPVGTVGLTEAQALEQFGQVDLYTTRFRPMRHTLSGRDERTLVKLVVDTATQRVLGAHMVGADAPEIIQGIAIAVKLGASKSDFDATIGIHPTAAEEFVTLRDRISRTRSDAAPRVDETPVLAP